MTLAKREDQALISIFIIIKFSAQIKVRKDLMQGKLFQRCTHLLYCSVLSLGGNVNTRQMSKPDMGSIFHIKNQWHILVIGKYCVNYQNYQTSMLLTYSDTKRTLMHLFLFTNSAQRELVSICTQSIYFPSSTFLTVRFKGTIANRNIFAWRVTLI